MIKKIRVKNIKTFEKTADNVFAVNPKTINKYVRLQKMITNGKADKIFKKWRR